MNESHMNEVFKVENLEGYNFHFKALTNTVSVRNTNWVLEQNYHNVVGTQKVLCESNNLSIQLKKI